MLVGIRLQDWCTYDRHIYHFKESPRPIKSAYVRWGIRIWKVCISKIENRGYYRMMYSESFEFSVWIMMHSESFEFSDQLVAFNSLKLRDISVSQAIIGSDNGLSPDRCQAIIWTTVGMLSVGPSGTKLKFESKYKNFHSAFEDIVCKMPAILSWAQCVTLPCMCF